MMVMSSKWFCAVIMLIQGLGLSGLRAQVVADIDGNVYPVVKIGPQIWMGANLRTTRYANGDAIGTTKPDGLDISNVKSPKYQWSYGGNESLVREYGRLYTWYVVADGRNLCPSGWHVPTDDDWNVLLSFVGKKYGGLFLKEAGSRHWFRPLTFYYKYANTGGYVYRDSTGRVDTLYFNNYKFSALGSGYRRVNGEFVGLKLTTDWWATSEESVEKGYCFYMSDLGYGAELSRCAKSIGLSVRCIQDLNVCEVR